MTAGRSRADLGVTDAMIETYGETIFDYSHNRQIRRGDPVRLLDFEAYEKNRVNAGLSDIEIAGRLGLTREQVTVIRNIVERRKIRVDTYYRLNALGGGRRYRAELEQDMPVPNTRLKDSLKISAERMRAMTEAGIWTSETLPQWLESHAKSTPDRPAIVSDAGTLTYRQLADTVRNTARGLLDLGLVPGDVVAVQLPNTAEYLIAYLAAASFGGVLSTIYMPYRATEMETLLGHSRAAAFVGFSKLGDFSPAGTVRALSDKLPAMKAILTVDGEAEGCVPFASLDRPIKGRAAETMPPAAADPLLLLYTSGTTASPKGVPLTSQMMLSNARLGLAEHRFTAEDRILSLAPYGHLYGLYSFHLALCAGATTVLLPEFSPPGFVAAVEKHRPTAVFAAPAHIAACLGGGLFDGKDLSSLKLAVLSGARVPPEVARAFDERMPNGHVSQLWGMTEMQAGTYTRPGDALEVPATSAGRASPKGAIRVADPETGEVLPPDTEGELQFTGPGLFAGYLDNADANATAFTEDGWFATGDLAEIDAAGNLRLTGRSKDIINRGGVKFNPLDIERLLDAHPAIQQSAVAPIPDPVLGEKACAYVVLTPGVETTLEELCAYLLEHGIAKTKLPERLETVAEMPMTATRKIIKGRLKPSSG